MNGKWRTLSVIDQGKVGRANHGDQFIAAHAGDGPDRERRDSSLFPRESRGLSAEWELSPEASNGKPSNTYAAIEQSFWITIADEHGENRAILHTPRPQESRADGEISRSVVAE